MINFEKLKEKIPHKWRVQQAKNGKATIVAYIDARDAQNMLDKVVGPQNWSTRYQVINGNLFCGVSINVNEDSKNPCWVEKMDCGVESNMDKEKGESSDAFKRACVLWGVGRFLYSLGTFTLNTRQYKNGKEFPVDKNGNFLFGTKLSEYISSLTVEENDDIETPETKPEQAKPAAVKSETKKLEWSDAAREKAKGLVRGTLSGQPLLEKYIPDYNKKNGTNYTKLVDLYTDKELLSLVKFIEDIPPVTIA